MECRPSSLDCCEPLYGCAHCLAVALDCSFSSTSTVKSKAQVRHRREHDPCADGSSVSQSASRGIGSTNVSSAEASQSADYLSRSLRPSKNKNSKVMRKIVSSQRKVGGERRHSLALSHQKSGQRARSFSSSSFQNRMKRRRLSDHSLGIATLHNSGSMATSPASAVASIGIIDQSPSLPSSLPISAVSLARKSPKLEKIIDSEQSDSEVIVEPEPHCEEEKKEHKQTEVEVNDEAVLGRESSASTTTEGLKKGSQLSWLLSAKYSYGSHRSLASSLPSSPAKDSPRGSEGGQSLSQVIAGAMASFIRVLGTSSSISSVASFKDVIGEEAGKPGLLGTALMPQPPSVAAPTLADHVAPVSQKPAASTAKDARLSLPDDSIRQRMEMTTSSSGSESVGSSGATAVTMDAALIDAWKSHVFPFDSGARLKMTAELLSCLARFFRGVLLQMDANTQQNLCQGIFLGMRGVGPLRRNVKKPGHWKRTGTAKSTASRTRAQLLVWKRIAEILRGLEMIAVSHLMAESTAATKRSRTRSGGGTTTTTTATMTDSSTMINRHKNEGIWLAGMETKEESEEDKGQCEDQSHTDIVMSSSMFGDLKELSTLLALPTFDSTESDIPDSTDTGYESKDGRTTSEPGSRFTYHRRKVARSTGGRGYNLYSERRRRMQMSRPLLNEGKHRILEVFSPPVVEPLGRPPGMDQWEQQQHQHIHQSEKGPPSSVTSSSKLSESETVSVDTRPLLSQKQAATTTAAVTPSSSSKSCKSAGASTPTAGAPTKIGNSVRVGTKPSSMADRSSVWMLTDGFSIPRGTDDCLSDPSLSLGTWNSLCGELIEFFLEQFPIIVRRRASQSLAIHAIAAARTRSRMMDSSKLFHYDWSILTSYASVLIEQCQVQLASAFLLRYQLSIDVFFTRAAVGLFGCTMPSLSSSHSSSLGGSGSSSSSSSMSGTGSIAGAATTTASSATTKTDDDTDVDDDAEAAKLVAIARTVKKHLCELEELMLNAESEVNRLQMTFLSDSMDSEDFASLDDDNSDVLLQFDAMAERNSVVSGMETPMAEKKRRLKLFDQTLLNDSTALLYLARFLQLEDCVDCSKAVQIWRKIILATVFAKRKEHLMSLITFFDRRAKKTPEGSHLRRQRDSPLMSGTGYSIGVSGTAGATTMTVDGETDLCSRVSTPTTATSSTGTDGMMMEELIEESEATLEGHLAHFLRNEMQTLLKSAYLTCVNLERSAEEEVDMILTERENKRNEADDERSSAKQSTTASSTSSSLAMESGAHSSPSAQAPGSSVPVTSDELSASISDSMSYSGGSQRGSSSLQRDLERARGLPFGLRGLLAQANGVSAVSSGNTCSSTSSETSSAAGGSSRGSSGQTTSHGTASMADLSSLSSAMAPETIYEELMSHKEFPMEIVMSGIRIVWVVLQRRYRWQRFFDTFKF